ncbi:MAG: hypothetical protein WEG36_06195 [Gemmatimonadota bacterium]
MGGGEQEEAAPVLSLICCSRNDNFQGNAMWRLQTGLNLTAKNVFELGLQDSVEIVLTDWGSREPIRKALTLTRDAASLLRILEVPRPIAERYQRDAPFSEVHALNAAARRTRGAYIGRIDQDTILGRDFFRRFFEFHRGDASVGAPLDKCQLLSNRRGVPFRVADACPSPWVIDRFVRAFGSTLPQAKPLPDHLYYQSYVGIWLVHRDLWFEIGGYDESFIYINWMEVDMILRLEPKYPFVNLGRLIDHDIYHLDHVHPFHYWGAKGRVRKENPYRDHDHPPEETFPNSSDWGLANEALELIPCTPAAGEAERAAASVYGAHPFELLYRIAAFALPWTLDRIGLALLRVAAAPVRLLLRLAPGLKEPVTSYRDLVRGHALTEWPQLFRDHHRARATQDRSEEAA